MTIGEWAPERPAVGFAPRLNDSELVTLAVIQALLGYTSEAQFICYARSHLQPWFVYLPDRPGYNRCLRRCGELLHHVIAYLARSRPPDTDDLWLVDFTPVECGRSRETAKRSDSAGVTLIADKGYRRASFETELNTAGITLIRPNLTTEKSRPGRRSLKAFRQTIESMNQTLTAQLDLERHGGRTRPGICARVPQRILALTAYDH